MISLLYLSSIFWYKNFCFFINLYLSLETFSRKINYSCYFFFFNKFFSIDNLLNYFYYLNLAYSNWIFYKERLFYFYFCFMEWYFIFYYAYLCDWMNLRISFLCYYFVRIEWKMNSLTMLERYESYDYKLL